MREFKFRVWNIKDKEWDNPAILEIFDKSGIFRPLYDPVENYVIQQFTGLKDKYGKEIYEGDIIKSKRWWTKPFVKDGHVDYEFIEGEEEIAQIFFGNCSFLVSFEHLRYDDVDEITKHDVPHRLEVIGNIFENPDLLK